MPTTETSHRELAVQLAQVLEMHFPWLSRQSDEPVSGADTVDQLQGLYRELVAFRRE